MVGLRGDCPCPRCHAQTSLLWRENQGALWQEEEGWLQRVARRHGKGLSSPSGYAGRAVAKLHPCNSTSSKRLSARNLQSRIFLKHTSEPQSDFSARLFVYFGKAKYIHSEVLKQRKLPSSQCWLLPAITPEEKFHKLLTPILLPISQQSCFLVFFHAFPNNLNFFCCIVKQSMNLGKTESQQQAESLCIKKGHLYFTFK